MVSSPTIVQAPKTLVTSRLDGAPFGELELLSKTGVNVVAVPQPLIGTLLNSTVIGIAVPPKTGKAASYMGLDTHGREFITTILHKKLPGVANDASVMVMLPSVPLLSCVTTASISKVQFIDGGSDRFTIPVRLTEADVTGFVGLDES